MSKLLEREFILTVIFVLAGLLGLLLGKFDKDTSFALIGVGLVVGGYAVSRGLAKFQPPGAMVMAFILAVGVAMSGSATLKSTGIEAALDLLREKETVVAEHYHQKCSKLAEACGKRDATCPEWEQCEMERLAIMQSFKIARLGIVEAGK